MSIDEKFVTLHLSHDDSKAQLGHSFLDTTRVALHFTDKVGRMGSILDNMLSICAKTKKGFAFSYYGNKSHKVQRCEWNAEKAMKMHEETADKKWLDNREVWSEERANKILNYYIPRRAEWDNEDKTFYFFDNGYGWGMSFAKKYLKRKDRRFWEVWNGWCGGEIRLYLINHFELEGFTKEVRNCENSWTDIIFTMKEN